jgi:hypothetical protein
VHERGLEPPRVSPPEPKCEQSRQEPASGENHCTEDARTTAQIHAGPAGWPTPTTDSPCVEPPADAGITGGPTVEAATSQGLDADYLAAALQLVRTVETALRRGEVKLACGAARALTAFVDALVAQQADVAGQVQPPPVNASGRK